MTNENSLPVAELVPMGKYKDRPLDDLLADQRYVQWLMAQPWFKERHAKLYQAVLTNGGEPQDSPEHNEMQARFLSEDWQRALVHALRPDIYLNDYLGRAYMFFAAICGVVRTSGLPTRVSDLHFEERGWDVTFAVQPSWLTKKWKPTDEQKAQLRLTVLDVVEAFKLEVVRASAARKGLNTMAVSPAGHEYRVELKPTLGDDFPAVLRQVKRAAMTNLRNPRIVSVLVVRRAAFEQVTLTQVRAMFEAEGIHLLLEQDIEARLFDFNIFTA